MVQQAQLHRTVEQSARLKRLASAGYARMLMFEIPALEDDADPDHAAAVESFLKSQEAISQGRYRHSVAAARDMLERLESAEKDKDAIATDRDFAKHLEGMRSWPKAKRIQFLRRALQTLTDAAVHQDDITVHIDWERKDALAVLQFQSGLLRLLSKK